MAVRLSALRACRLFTSSKIPGTLFCQSSEVRLEELGQLKSPMIASEIEPVAFYRNQLRYHLPSYL
jgi:hypothetical protein